MKILFGVPAYVPARQGGGTAMAAHELARHLAALGASVTVMTTDANGPGCLDVPLNRPVMLDGVEVWYFRNDGLLVPWPLSRLSYVRKSQGLIASRMLARAVAERIGEFDVLSLLNPFGHTNRVCSRAARRAGVPYVYYAHGMLQPSHLRFRAAKKRAYLALVERRILRQAAALVALTDDEAAALARLGARRAIHVIPNAVDMAQLSTTVLEPDQPLIRRLDGRQVILSLSRIHPTKGVDTLVEAFILIAGRFPQAVLVAAGPDEFGLSAGLRRRLEQAGLGDRVELPGLVTGALKRDLLARADVFVLPSHMEGFSMCILEAMGSSTPAVITPHCHFPQAVAAGAALEVEVRPEALAGALDRLLAEPALRQSMGRAARQLVQDRYQWTAVARATLAVFADVAGLPPPESVARASCP